MAASPLTLVFIHGFLGFNRLSLPFYNIHYFRGLERLLRRLAVPYLIPALPPAGQVAERAEVLSRHLSNSDAAAFVLVGHSMGGLDSRYLVQHFDPSHRVHTVVTLGTPHRGSSVADWIFSTDGPVQAICRRRWKFAIDDLTPGNCSRRNETLVDRDDVHYISYAGECDSEKLPFWLRPLGRIVSRHEGSSDGLVALSSAQWGEFRGSLPASHTELVGWSLSPSAAIGGHRFNHLDLIYPDPRVGSAASTFPNARTPTGAHWPRATSSRRLKDRR